MESTTIPGSTFLLAGCNSTEQEMKIILHYSLRGTHCQSQGRGRITCLAGLGIFSLTVYFIISVEMT